MTQPYTERFPVGTRVRIADRDTLDHFKREWRFHHPLQADQLSHSGHETVVRDVGYYHELLQLAGATPPYRYWGQTTFR